LLIQLKLTVDNQKQLQMVNSNAFYQQLKSKFQPDDQMYIYKLDTKAQQLMMTMPELSADIVTNGIVVTGGGALSLKGADFSYYNFADANRNTFVLENGSLIFDAATVNFNDFFFYKSLHIIYKKQIYFTHKVIYL
jgi:hypothetical protein